VLSVTAAQLDAWLGAFFFPLARILALLASAPVLNSIAVPQRVRLLAGLAITVGLAPALPPLPPVSPGSGLGLAILAQQVLIGLAMGFTMRVVFSAIDVAGELVGLQMGLSFAVFYDPQNTGQTAVVAEFLGLLATLVFLAVNGHLMVLAVLAQSFELLPIGAAPFAADGLAVLVRWGAVLFSAGVLLALPLIVALLITNIALGVLTRAAPTLNLFAVGFPVSLLVGFSVLLLALTYMAPVFQSLFERGLEQMGSVLAAGSGIPEPR
jgi:flagellar biosynthetic protein FliR